MPCASHVLLILGGVPDLGGAGGHEVDDDGRGRSVDSPATSATEHWMAISRTRGWQCSRHEPPAWLQLVRSHPCPVMVVLRCEQQLERGLRPRA